MPTESPMVRASAASKPASALGGASSRKRGGVRQRPKAAAWRCVGVSPEALRPQKGAMNSTAPALLRLAAAAQAHSALALTCSASEAAACGRVGGGRGGCVRAGSGSGSVQLLLNEASAQRDSPTAPQLRTPH